MKQFFKTHLWILLVIFIGGFLRFYNLSWDNGLFLHPDERLFVNASNLSFPKNVGDFFSVNSPLNPHMFYYGSTLLYLYKLLSLISPFSFLVTSRFVSAFLSSLTIGLIYVIGQKLFSKKVGLLSSIVFTFAAGSIQYAHFDTTESSLIFLLTLITYLDILSVKNKKPFFLLISLFLVAIAGSIKITGLIFGLSSFLAFCLGVLEHRSFRKTGMYFFIGCIIATLVYILLSPYQFIDWKDFASQQSYMQAVTYGVFKPPFVIIYQHTLPYLYQLIQIFPFAFGFVSLPLALIGCYSIGKKIINTKTQNFILLFLFIFPLFYFAWSGNWFAKYERYYILLLPFFSLWAGYVLSLLPKPLRLLLVFLIICNGLLFFRIYITSNTRVAASGWIYSHLPAHAAIATESWDDALPLLLPDEPTQQFTNISLPVYDPDTKGKIQTIATDLAKSNYFILSSRRVYASILQNSNLYPYTSNMYRKLFSGQLGFTKIYEKTNYPFFFSDDIADETFQSYDHPPVMIFANTKHFSKKYLISQLNMIQ